MTLPKILVPHDVVEVDGQTFDIRALTRGEAARFQKMVADGVSLADLEIAVLAAGTDTPKDEAQAWYEATPAHAVEVVITAIKDLSRLDEGAQKSG
jgi:hypothetical protein